MTTNINAAYRLYRILEKAQKAQGNKQTGEMWAELFGLSSPNSRLRNYEVARLVALFAGELEDVKMKIRLTGFGSDLYQKSFEAVEQVIVVDNLFNAWDNYKPILREEVFLALKWCTAAMQSEETPIEEADLTELSKELNELEKSVRHGNLTEQVKVFVLHHIELIRKAIREYPIVGIRAFSQAERDALMHFAIYHVVVRENESTPEVQKLGKIWKKVIKYVDEFSKVLKFLKEAKDAVDVVRGFLN